MNQFLLSLFDFFLPRFCPGCKLKLLPNENIICPSCIGKIKSADEDRLKSEFQRKFYLKNIITGFSSLYVFEKDKELQNIIHSLKYERRFQIGSYLGKIMGINLRDLISTWKIDLIIPIPLHHLKKAERGFNQSLYIAKGLSKELNISINDRLIRRKKFTESQTTMTLKEREENINGAFSIRKKHYLNGKNILLIDDVITTGATINECGKILLNSGVNKIYAASAAIAD